MPHDVRLSPEIEADVFAALDHYAAIDPVLAQRFVDEVERTLTLIRTYPLAGRFQYDDVRRMVLDRFPYLFSWPQSPSMSRPRVSRTVVGIPRLQPADELTLVLAPGAVHLEPCVS